MPVPVVFFFLGVCFGILVQLLLRLVQMAYGDNHNDKACNNKYCQNNACIDKDSMIHWCLYKCLLNSLRCKDMSFGELSKYNYVISCGKDGDIFYLCLRLKKQRLHL